jgi:hypothetical protein
MRTLILALLVATGVQAEEAKTCHTVTVCDFPVHKHVVKPSKKKILVKAPVKDAPVVVVKEPTPTVVIDSPAPTSWATTGRVNVYWNRTKPDFVLGLHGAVGLGFMDPHTSGLLGARAHYLPWHLGAELYTAFAYGTAFEVLGYTYQGDHLSHHIDLGVLFANKKLLSDLDVPRTWT